MEDDSIAAALTLSRKRWSLLEAGDIDEYLAGLDEFGELCAAACAAFGGEGGHTAANEALFAELVAVNEHLLAETSRRKEEAAAHLASLWQGRRAASAYFTTAPMARPIPRLEG